MTVHVYQIYYSEETRKNLDSGFIPLDNTPNERPDWREIWAIRNFLNSNTLNEVDHYGFLSPKFVQKTGLTFQELQDFIQRDECQSDVYLFSQFVFHNYFSRSVFHQGESRQPGVMPIAQDFLNRIDVRIDLKELVTNTTNSVFSHFLVARPSFWRLWSQFSEKLFQIAEGEDSDLKQRLNSLAVYSLPVQFKVFVMERIPSLILVLHPELKVIARSPKIPMTASGQPPAGINDALICDALKIAYCAQGMTAYISLFEAIQKVIVPKISSNPDF